MKKKKTANNRIFIEWKVTFIISRIKTVDSCPTKKKNEAKTFSQCICEVHLLCTHKPWNDKNVFKCQNQSDVNKRKSREWNIKSRQAQRHTLRQAHTHIHCTLGETQSQVKGGREKEKHDKERVYVNPWDRERERRKERFFLLRQSCHRLQYTSFGVCE